MISKSCFWFSRSQACVSRKKFEILALFQVLRHKVAKASSSSLHIDGFSKKILHIISYYFKYWSLWLCLATEDLRDSLSAGKLHSLSSLCDMTTRAPAHSVAFLEHPLSTMSPKTQKTASSCPSSLPFVIRGLKICNYVPGCHREWSQNGCHVK